jgi:hypothetical protein
MAWWTPIQLDDWYEIAWIERHGYSAGEIVDFARYNYFNYNPRLGETLLFVVNGPPIIHYIVTPAVQLLFLGVCFALTFGAWPRPTLRDLGRLILVQGMIWMVVPVPGPIYFYRPFATNYLFAFCFQLLLFVPIRLALARGADVAVRRGKQIALAIAMPLWGVVAGMTNEHTGPTAIVVALALCWWARRHGRLRPWIVLGTVGLVVGYALLFFAPGQTVRYAGLQTDIAPMATLLRRGFANLRLFGELISNIQHGVAIAVVAAVIAAWRGRLDGLGRAPLVLAGVAMAAAFAIVATLFASPIVTDRVFFASCVLAAIAIGAVTDALAADRVVRRVVSAAMTAVVVIHVVGFVVVYRELSRDTDRRLAALAAAGPDDVVEIAPAREYLRDRWRYGEDFQFAYMREFVARRVYRVAGLEFDRPVAWAQPTPPETNAIAVRHDPPVDLRAALPNWPLHDFVPTQWAWIVRELRESWADLTSIPGHALREIDVTVTPVAPLPGPPRPIYIVRWRDGKFWRIDGQPRRDKFDWPYLSIRHPRVPIEITEAYLQGCGRTEATKVTKVGREWRIATRYICSGNHTVYACDATACWLAGRYW